ncbi:MAG: glycosyltransferase family 4 protein [Bacteroidia bacterium]|nr:glycosyltransferase family 4 protein [Bacteroidia bacterium]
MTVKKEIVVDARMIESSGIGTYLQEILPCLMEQFPLTLLGEARKLNQAFPDLSRNYKHIEVSAAIYSIREQWALFRNIPATSLGWSPHYNVPLLPVAAKFRLVTIHDVYHLAFQNQLSFLKKKYAQLMIKAATQRSARIITVSQFSKREITKYTHVNPDKIVVIPNGVNDRYFKTIADHNYLEMIHKKYNLPPQFLLFVGNVKPHKKFKSCFGSFATG